MDAEGNFWYAAILKIYYHGLDIFFFLALLGWDGLVFAAWTQYEDDLS